MRDKLGVGRLARQSRQPQCPPPDDIGVSACQSLYLHLLRYFLIRVAAATPARFAVVTKREMVLTLGYAEAPIIYAIFSLPDKNGHTPGRGRFTLLLTCTGFPLIYGYEYEVFRAETSARFTAF